MLGKELGRADGATSEIINPMEMNLRIKIHDSEDDNGGTSATSKLPNFLFLISIVERPNPSGSVHSFGRTKFKMSQCTCHMFL